MKRTSKIKFAYAYSLLSWHIIKKWHEYYKVLQCNGITISTWIAVKVQLAILLRNECEIWYFVEKHYFYNANFFCKKMAVLTHKYLKWAMLKFSMLLILRKRKQTKYLYCIICLWNEMKYRGQYNCFSYCIQRTYVVVM